MDAPYRGDAVLEQGLSHLGYDPFARLHEGTRMHQPALLLCGVAAWEAAGRPGVAAAAGHSLGEYTALVAAGSLSLQDALTLVDTRAAAMAAAARRTTGGMVAMLGGDDATVRDLAEELHLTVANDNAPGQIVLSGQASAIEAASARAEELRIRARRLDVTGAFHSPLMQPAAAGLRGALARVEFAPPHFPVYSGATARPFEDPREELARNLVCCVRFRETLLAMRAAGIEEFVELGPGKVLTGLVKHTLLRPGRGALATGKA
jgi:[acyl-carrier-protein] S-malonyltransferase